jgi:two-component system, OmpR family, response regulator MtrA
MGKKLLMIDDDAGIAGVVGLVARELGMEFRTIASPLTAKEVFAAYRPDIVIIDMIMAEKDGIDVLSEILATGIPTKVVLTSGFGDSHLRLGVGVAKFHGKEGVPLLKKPFRRAELIELLNTIAGE